MTPLTQITVIKVEAMQFLENTTVMKTAKVAFIRSHHTHTETMDIVDLSDIVTMATRTKLISTANIMSLRMVRVFIGKVLDSDSMVSSEINAATTVCTTVTKRPSYSARTAAVTCNSVRPVLVTHRIRGTAPITNTATGISATSTL